MQVIQNDNRLFWQRDGDKKPTYICRASPGVKELLQDAIDTGVMMPGSLCIELSDLVRFSEAAAKYRKGLKTKAI